MKAMIKSNLNFFIRECGVNVTYLQQGEIETDLDSGDIVRELTETSFRGLYLPQKISREFNYDLAYLAANSRFTMGGHYDKNYCGIVTFKSRLPLGFSINDDLVVDGKQYKVEDFFDMLLNVAVGINLVSVEGSNNA